MSPENFDNTISTRIMSKDGGDMPARILVVDDDGFIRDMLKNALEPIGYHVDLAFGSGDALEKLIDYKYNLLVLDANLPGISGFELLKYCKKHHPVMEIIMITGNPELDDAISTVKDGAFDYLPKPFSIEKLLSRTEDALKHQKDELIKSLSPANADKLNNPHNFLLPEYKIIKTLGTGMMGIVFLAEKDCKQYALKVLRREGDDVGHAARLKRFLREAKILSQIEHPNVVRVYDFGFPKDSEIPYIVMEYVPGKSLTTFIKENKLTLEQKLYIIAQIAAALAIVHKFGVLHRDVKPSNILVTDDFIAKLSDFGIAKISDSSLTMTHEVLGSPAYMPPETFKQNKILDCRSDIFSLGIMSYELITGMKPFHGETVGEMMDAIQNARPQEPRKINPELPLSVQNLLEKMLKKKPEERFQSAAKIIEAINNLQKKDEEADGKLLGLLKNIITGGSRVWS